MALTEALSTSCEAPLQDLECARSDLRLERVVARPAKDVNGSRSYAITFTENGSTCTILRRYSDFVWLDCQLTGTCRLPLPPSKRHAGLVGICAGRFLRDRLHGLEQYLEHLFAQIDSSDDLPGLADFLASSQGGHPYSSERRYSSESIGSLDDFLTPTIGTECSPCTGRDSDNVTCVTFSSDMSLIAFGRDDSTCQLWTRDHEQRWQNHSMLEGHNARITAVAIAEDISMIASGSDDMTCRIWTASSEGRQYRQKSLQARQWQCQCILRGHEAALRCVAISCDLSFIATVSDDASCFVWNMSKDGWDAQDSDALLGHIDAINGLTIASDSSFFATASSDTTCRVWHRTDTSWCCHQVLEGYPGKLYRATISVDKALIATIGEVCTCHLWVKQESNKWGLLQVLFGHEFPIRSIAIAPNSCLIATGDEGGICRLWIPQGNLWSCGQTLTEHSDAMRGIHIATRNRHCMIGTASADQSILFWRYENQFAYKATHIRHPSKHEIILAFAVMVISLLQNVTLSLSDSLCQRSAILSTMRGILRVVVIIDFPSVVSPTVEYVLLTVLFNLAAFACFACAILGRGLVIVFVLSTICITPMMEQFATQFACRNGHLEVAPDLLCYTGIHLQLMSLALICGLMYFVLVVGPLTVAEGDLQIAPRQVWFRPREWIKRKSDKNEGLNLGLLNASKRGAVTYAYVNMFTRLSLSWISVRWQPNMLSSIVLSLVVASSPLVVTFWRAPLEHSIACNYLRAGHSLCVIAFFAQLIDVLILDPESFVPLMVLFVGWGGITSVLLLQLMLARMSQSNIA